MAYLKTALLILTLASLNAGAQQGPPPAPATPQEKAEPPLAPVMPPKRKPIKRRSVQQVVEPTPRIGVAPPSYGPTLTPRPPTASPDPLPAPVRINGCDAGGCNGSNGARYNGGVGTTLLSPEGRLCHNNGVTVQC